MSETSDLPPDSASDAEQAPPLAPIRIAGQYIKDLSFEVPHAPDIYAQLQREAASARRLRSRHRGSAQRRQPGSAAWSVRSTCSGVRDTNPFATAWKSVPSPASRASPAGPIQ